MNVAIIGTGLQANRRCSAIQKFSDDKITFVASSNKDRAQIFANSIGVKKFGNWQDVVKFDDIDAAIICTTPDTHAEIIQEYIKYDIHILCEKPLTKTLDEAYEIKKKLKKSSIIFQCGFNHRFHPAIIDAKKALEKNEIGKPIFGRCRYGICGRPEYESEWRGKSEIATGGQLMELGIHPIDLFRWMIGEIKEVSSMVTTSFFPMHPLEDNGMAIIKTEQNVICSLHASLTQWKNMFSFEITGTDGYLNVEGLGDSYGTQKLSIGKRDYIAPFAETVTEYRGSDKSWYNEWKNFKDCVKDNKTPSGNINDAIQAMKVIFSCYESSKKGKNILVKKN